MINNRRSFFRWSLGGAGGLFVGNRLSDLSPPDEPSLDQWLKDLGARKHKAFLDVRGFSVDAAPFRRAASLLTVLQDTYGAPAREVGVAFGAHGTALGYMVNAALWAELNLVEKIAAQLHPAAASQLRAPGKDWSALGADGVRDLRSKGVVVLACRNTIGRWARDYAAERGGSADDAVKKIVAGLHQGVEPVPAMIAAAVLAQARDFGYVALE